jgi:hypothetical protein
MAVLPRDKREAPAPQELSGSCRFSPTGAYTAAVSNVRSQSLATNVRNPPQPWGASIDGHSYVVP